jgi:23S rRNA (adenine2503-C2)-methyltransferase
MEEEKVLKQESICYPSPTMQHLCSLSIDDFKNWLTARGEKPFRAAQVFDWVYAQGVTDFEAMTNLGKTFREELAKSFQFPALRKLRTQVSEDGETVKYLWELPDRSRIESVLIISGDRRTVCISCQVGCPARCAFCASGKEGLLRCLSAGEIVEQVLHIDRELKQKGERVSHLVFMGMGEPMENYEAVVRAIAILNHPSGLQISQRRITISTVGVVEGIHRLAEEELQVNLVLSLHAPNQHLRKKIIPYARKYPLEEILLAMDAYAAKTKRDITYEYTLLAGINDQRAHAEELAALLKGKQCTVNLIPYNPVDGLQLRRPEKEVIERFRSILEAARINTTWRYTKGKDIAAACGQLALQKEEGAAPALALVPKQPEESVFGAVNFSSPSPVL